ncbi:MAG: prephenate dehydrogenase dimerization domain-containing protein [Christensenellales bacterium]
MKVGIIGLGLMGASFARTLKKAGGHEVYGFDRSDDVMRKADLIGMLDGTLTPDNAGEIDMIIVALYPAISKRLSHRTFRVLNRRDRHRFCGTKRLVVSEMQKMQKEYPDLFSSADTRWQAEVFGDRTLGYKPFRSCVNDNRSRYRGYSETRRVKEVLSVARFRRIMVCSADYHDGMIAFTSQLCHIVSNAYVKISAPKFTTVGGSYRDLTRVARLNSKMWSELMIDNRDFLSDELAKLSDILPNTNRLSTTATKRVSLRSSRTATAANSTST